MNYQRLLAFSFTLTLALSINIFTPRSSAQTRQERIYSGEEVSRKVVLISKPNARYTDAGRTHETEGSVILRVVFRSDRQIGEITVLQGLADDLTEAALAAARTITFEPAEKDGHPVSQYLTLEYRFSI